MRYHLSALVAYALSACGPAGEEPSAVPLLAFVDVAESAGMTRAHTGGGLEKRYIVEAKGGGGAVLDLEGDGDMDVYWVNGATFEDRGGAGNALYRNDGGLRFADIAGPVGAQGRGWGMGAVSADYDNDGDTDLFVTCLEEDLLYRNESRADPAFAAVPVAADLSGWHTGAAFGDYDNDGDLDLYVAGYAEFDRKRIEPLGSVWRGTPVFVGPVGLTPAADVLLRNDNGQFAVACSAGVEGVDPAYGLGVLFADSDDDGDVDLFVANDSMPNFLFRNDGGHFTESALDAGLAFGGMGNEQASMGVAWGDYDGDLRPDLFATHFEDDYNTLYRNEGAGRFVDATLTAGLGAVSFSQVGFGATFADFDRDGDRDLFVANGHVHPQMERSNTGSAYAQPNQLLENKGDGSFAAVDAFADERRVSRTALAGDFDDDGDLDLFVHNLNDRLSLRRNDGGAENHWLGVRLVGTAGNRDGVGARVLIVAGGRTQVGNVMRGSSFLGAEDPRLFFGLGEAMSVDSLIIRWPTGKRQVIVAPPIDRYLLATEE